jgi:hypothetical protein
MDPEMFGYWLDRWYAEGWIRYALQTPADVVAVILDALRADAPSTFIEAHAAEELTAAAPSAEVASASR